MTDVETKYLGRQVAPTEGPEDFVLDRVPNPMPGEMYVARFTCPEMTSLCPATGQPDFATLVIDYAPDVWLIESKSLKLFVASFRNHGAFHEACTLTVARRLADLVQPHWMRVVGLWAPRGGIPIDVFWQSGEPPAGLLVPAVDERPYSSR